MNSFDKVIAIFLGVTLMFFVPLLLLAQKQDSITQSYVSTTTTQFVDSIKNSGYLSRDMYQTYTQKIDKTGNLYNIEICHSHKIVEPNYDEESNTILDGYSKYYLNTYQDEILEAFDQGLDYKFNQGDFISITVVNRNKTTATRIMESFYRSDIEDTQILVTYGGMVRDELN